MVRFNVSMIFFKEFFFFVFFYFVPQFILLKTNKEPSEPQAFGYLRSPNPDVF